jgi:hypothetical protein
VVLYRECERKGEFKVRYYLEDAPEQRLVNAKHALELMRYNVDDSAPYWDSRDGSDSRDGAIGKLCELAKIVDSLRK